MKFVLRLLTMALAGLFAARGGWWWIMAGAYFLITLAPIRPRGTRAAFIACVVGALIFLGLFARYALVRDYSPLLAVLALYGGAQALQEWLALRQGAPKPVG